MGYSKGAHLFDGNYKRKEKGLKYHPHFRALNTIACCLAAISTLIFLLIFTTSL